MRRRPVGAGKGAAGSVEYPTRDTRPTKHGEIKRIAQAPCTGLLRVVSGLVSLYGLWQTCSALWAVRYSSTPTLRADVQAARTATLGYTMAALCIALDRNVATMILSRCSCAQGRCNSRELGTRRYAVFALKTLVNVIVLPLVYTSIVGAEWLRTVVVDPLTEVAGTQLNLVEIITAGMFTAATTVLCLEASRMAGLDPPRGTPRKQKVDDDDDFIVSASRGPWNPTQIEYRSGRYTGVLVLCKFIHTCVVVPFAEELFYRVFIVSRVAKTHIHLAHMDLTLDMGENHWIPAVLVGAMLFGCGERNFALGPVAGVVWGFVQSLVMRNYGVGAAILTHATRSACVGVYVMAMKEWVLWSPSV
eukprot:g1103.t1